MAYWETIQYMAIELRDFFFGTFIFLLFTALFSVFQCGLFWLVSKFPKGDADGNDSAKNDDSLKIALNAALVTTGLVACAAFFADTIKVADLHDHGSDNWHHEILMSFSQIYVLVALIEAPIAALVMIIRSFCCSCAMPETDSNSTMPESLREHLAKLSTQHNENAESDADIELGSVGTAS